MSLVSGEIGIEEMTAVLEEIDSCFGWCSEVKMDESTAAKAASKLDPGASSAEVWATALEDGAVLIMKDREDDSYYFLSSEKLKAGISMQYDENCEEIDEWGSEDFDAALQYALFEEVVY